ncbi:MAG TPA: hypothetical protein VF821_04075, partial [Lentzea sp.]
RVVRSSDTRESKMGASSNRAFSYSVGPEARLIIPTSPDDSSLVVVPNMSVKYNSSTTHQNASGPLTVNFLVNAGSSTSHRFSSGISYEVTVETYSRPKAWVRRLRPGLPGWHTPKVKTIAQTAPADADPDTVALDEVTGEVQLFLPDSSVLTEDPAQFRPGTPVEPERMEQPPSITDLLLHPRNVPDGQTAVTEWLHVEAFTGADHLEQAALAALDQAAGGDQVLTLPGSASRRAADQMFAPEHVKANLNHAVNTGLQENALKYGRRLEDRFGALGTKMVLTNPKLVSISDNTAMEYSSVGGTKAGASKSKSKGWDFSWGTALIAAPDSGAERPTIGRGGAAISNKLFSWRTTVSKVREMTGLGERKRNLPGTSRTVLIQVDANVDIVAESRVGSLVHSRQNGREGVHVVLPGAVYLRVSEEQARALGLLPEVTDRPWTEQGALAPPSTMRAGEPSSLGFGVFEELPDLTPMVPGLRDKLGETGADLIPDAVLDDAMNNLQRVLDLADKETVRAMMDSALDGGVPLVAHDPKIFGRDSYQVVLKARPGEPEFRDVVNDGVKMNNILVYFGRNAETKARTKSWGASIRALFGVVPHAADPARTGNLTGAAATEIGQSRTGSTTTAFTALDVHVLDADGPTARYSVPVEWELEIRKPDGTTESVTASEIMTMRVLADDQSSTPSPAPQHRETERRSDAEATAEALAQWKSEGVHLPRTVHPQTTVGAAELRAVALRALTAAGLSADATGPARGLTNTALSGLGAESLRTGVIDASYEGVVLPELHETALLSGKHATLEVHSRLVEPRLTGLSDDVTMINQRAMIPGTGSEFAAGESVDTTLAVNGELGTTNGKTEKVRDPGARFGDFDAKAAFGQSESFGSEVGSARQEGTGDSGRTGLVTYDVEYRVIATVDGTTAVFDVHRSRSGQIRVAQVDLEVALGRSVSADVNAAQDEV